jgi:hypothetical protein
MQHETVGPRVFAEIFEAGEIIPWIKNRGIDTLR